jgi:pimeloyl-ACP methyl ester carboxylesterase
MNTKCPRECLYEIDGIPIAGRLWGDTGPKLIALHGWLDNAASFDALAAQLPDTQLLALDLPGHGHSGHKPPSGGYAIWDDLRSVLGVADQLAWDRFVIVGHSRGAMMASLLAAAVPERVDALVCIDGMAAPPLPEEDFPRQLGQYLREYGASAGPLKSYASLQEAADARIKAMPMSNASALKIVERGTYRGDDGRYYWRSDRRASLASPVKLSAGQWQAVVKQSVPSLFICAESGFGHHMPNMFPELEQHFEVAYVAGGHHCHMDTGVDVVAEKLRAFIARHLSA